MDLGAGGAAPHLRPLLQEGGPQAEDLGLLRSGGARPTGPLNEPPTVVEEHL